MNQGNIRKEFPALRNKVKGKRLIYFDNACSALRPKCVIRSVNKFYSSLGVCSGTRSSHLLSWRTQELIEEARETVREFLNASSVKEIVWTKNATEGINLVAATFPFTKTRNEVILSLLEHHSMLLPFYEQARKRGFVLKCIKPAYDGSFDIAALKKSVSKKTALIGVTHLSNVTGLISPVRDIAVIAHQYGAKILVDDAQFVATCRENVKENQIDFLVFSGHKIGGPNGIGVLFIKQACTDGMLTGDVGGGTVESVSFQRGRMKVSYLPFPARLEAGIQNYAGIIGLGKAVRFLREFGQEKTAKKVKGLSSYAVAQLKQIKEARFLADYAVHDPASIVSFCFNGTKLSLYDFNLFLNHGLKNHVIAVRCGHHCAEPLHDFLGTSISMRLSFFIYNSEEEIDVFTHAMRQFLQKR